tara:strand:+ start:84 stop:302 length:219 start_codon:yes stop_codon:yes gene_type:complete
VIIFCHNFIYLGEEIKVITPNKSHKIITYLSKYFSIAMPDPKIIKEAKNNLGSMSLGYLTITPIGIEKIPNS